MDNKINEVNRIKIDNTIKILENNISLLEKILVSPNASFTPRQINIIRKLSDTNFKIKHSLKEIYVP